jgi:hypothetical protein
MITSTIKRYWGKKSYKDIGKMTGQTADAVRKMGRNTLHLPPVRKNAQNKHLSPEKEIERDVVLGNLENEGKHTQKKYDLVCSKLADAEAIIEAFKIVGTANTYTIKSIKSDPSGEVTAVAVLSDIHYAETVKSDNVNGKNEYNPKIAKTRLEFFFKNLAKLIIIYKHHSQINNLVLAMLGDMINGHLREESLENNSMSPIEEMLEVKGVLEAGINYLLDNTDVNIVLPCHSGNHARDTQKIRPSTEAGHSYEYVLYHVLANAFKDNPRVKFIIPTSYHSYIDVGGLTIRFHHGHFMKYNGGMSGIYISVNKAIAQWNKVQHADLDVFGHFHQLRDGGNFICNGSVIGFNSFAISIKADYEKPKQAFFLIDHKRKEKTSSSHIFLS